MKQLTVFVFILIALSCNRIAMRSLSSSSPPAGHDCIVPESASGQTAFIEDSLKLRNARSAKLFRITANFGSPEKYAKLFRVSAAEEEARCVLVLHFIDNYAFDRIQGDAVFIADKDSLRKPIFSDPASVIISEVSDQFYYFYLSDSEARKLAISDSVTGQIGPIGFEIPFLCRNEWRELFGDGH